MSNECITAEEIQEKLACFGNPTEWQKAVMGEWVVAPEPRDYPKQLHYAMPAQEGEINSDGMSFNSNIGVRVSLSYQDVKQMIEQLREAELRGDLLLPNDEVIMEFSISSRSQYPRMAGLCTPSRNLITGHNHVQS